MFIASTALGMAPYWGSSNWELLPSVHDAVSWENYHRKNIGALLLDARPSCQRKEISTQILAGPRKAQDQSAAAYRDRSELEIPP